MKSKIEITKGIKDINKSLVISGRNLGEDQRKKFHMDAKDKDSNNYIITIPNNIISVNSSFFLGAFGKSVRNFKSKEKFLEKYEFNCNENALITINDGINDALNNVDILSNIMKETVECIVSNNISWIEILNIVIATVNVGAVILFFIFEKKRQKKDKINEYNLSWYKMIDIPERTSQLDTIVKDGIIFLEELNNNPEKNLDKRKKNV
jgi:hypothetical protein